MSGGVYVTALLSVQSGLLGIGFVQNTVDKDVDYTDTRCDAH